MQEPPSYVEVAIPLGVPGTFTYAVPPELSEEVERGMRVEVPWGSRLITGFVVGNTQEPSVEPSRIREIESILDDSEPALLPEIVDLCLWASHYYLTPLGEMLRVALPSSMVARGRRRIRLESKEEEIDQAIESGQILESDREVVATIRRGVRDVSALIRQIRGARGAISRLTRARLIRVEETLRDAEGVRFDRWVRLSGESGRNLSEKQRHVLDRVRAAGGEIRHQELEAAGASSSSVATLVKHGVLLSERRPRSYGTDPLIDELAVEPVLDLEYSAGQREAIDAILEQLDTFEPFLIQGVTGSGKTEIYLQVARRVVQAGRQAIILVPEISLTPALAGSLRHVFGERVAILHSSLSAGERHDQWRRARTGEVDIAVGPRSALFTPFSRLGLIVVDEEGDGAYKQEETPRYNARDLAVVRARISNVPVLLGSATPSLESRENAERGKYRLIHLPDRVARRPLPLVETIDLKHQKALKEDRGLILFSDRLREELEAVLSRGEQAMILINRRGYAPFLLCRQCENDFRCRDCSVTMTVHRREGRLVCHYCGHSVSIPAACTRCGGEVLQPIGFGTEKVEERFRTLFPEVSVAVLDRDAVRKKGELVRILSRFKSGKTQTLIGTQMLSKGHDFPNVTLTAVLNADALLGFPDFRSAEKTFSLLTQLAGRAGRGDLGGRVLIQTSFPDHYAIQCALRHDYDGFFSQEMEFRRRFHYPPVTAMIALLFRGEDEAAVEGAAGRIGRRLERESGSIAGARLQGPAPAPLARIKGSYRYQILIRGPERGPLRKAVAMAINTRLPARVDLVVDVDPLNIL